MIIETQTQTLADGVLRWVPVVGWSTVICVAAYVAKLSWTVRGYVDKAVSNHLTHIEDGVVKVREHIESAVSNIKEEHRRGSDDIVKALDRMREASERHKDALVQAIYTARQPRGR